MAYVAIEFDNEVNNSHVKGILRIPNNFNPSWHVGFRLYLVDKYKASNINIYPYRHHEIPDTMGCTILGFSNIEDDFILALRSNKYYPSSKENDNIRRQWSMLDSTTQSFTVKERE